MADTEIKKALECCAYLEACADCPFGDIEGVDKCMHSMMQNALDLINRQQAEIERLNRITDDLVKIADTRKKANFLLLQEKILLTKELKSAKAETTEQLSKKIESRLANNTDISNVQYQSIIFDISEACKETVGDAE